MRHVKELATKLLSHIAFFFREHRNSLYNAPMVFVERFRDQAQTAKKITDSCEGGFHVGNAAERSGLIWIIGRGWRFGRPGAIVRPVHFLFLLWNGGTTARRGCRLCRAFCVLVIRECARDLAEGRFHAALSVKKAISVLRSTTHRPLTFLAGS